MSWTIWDAEIGSHNEFRKSNGYGCRTASERAVAKHLYPSLLHAPIKACLGIDVVSSVLL